MQTSLERLLSGSIDYAGTFPPARRDLETSLRRYLAYLRGPERWIVHRLVCGVSDLARLPDLLNTNSSLEVAAVVRYENPGREAVDSALRQAAETFNDVTRRSDGRIEIAAMEVPLPDGVEPSDFAHDLTGFAEAEVYLELPPSADLRAAVATLAETQWIGAKLRTGGLTAESFPSSDVVSEFLLACLDLDVPAKLTAGLHHALPSDDVTSGGRQHGFINVIAGAVLARAHDLSRREYREILEDRDVRAWRFEEDGFAYRDWEASLDDIDEARATLRSFGSCSVEEPLAELDFSPGRAPDAD
jgi:hypothetical protein